MALSATRVRALKDPGRFSDGGGLHLFISRAGSKSWVIRTTIDGRRRDIGLGGYPAVSLAQAREKAAEFRAAVAAGQDPLAVRSRPRVPTFREAARAVHEANKPRWRNAKHAEKWLQVLEGHANASYQIVIEGSSYRQKLSSHRKLLGAKEVIDLPKIT